MDSLELRRFAEILGVPIDAFFDESPGRVLALSRGGDDRMTNWASSFSRTWSSLRPKSPVVAGEPRLVGAPPWKQGEDAALALRHRLELASGPVNVWDLIRRMGVPARAEGWRSGSPRRTMVLRSQPAYTDEKVKGWCKNLVLARATPYEKSGPLATVEPATRRWPLCRS
ncbi:MAG: hypothetical protein ACR2KV_00870 [Solirubrobacteraceae bacterium]